MKVKKTLYARIINKGQWRLRLCLLGEVSSHGRVGHGKMTGCGEFLCTIQGVCSLPKELKRPRLGGFKWSYAGWLPEHLRKENKSKIKSVKAYAAERGACRVQMELKMTRVALTLMQIRSSHHWDSGSLKTTIVAE